MRRVNVLPLVVVIALGASACGSSSKSSTAANPPVTPSSPSTPSTPSTPTTTTSGGKISSTTPITAPVVRAKFITEIVKGGTPPATAKREAGKIADCAIPQLK